MAAAFAGSLFAACLGGPAVPRQARPEATPAVRDPAVFVERAQWAGIVLRALSQEIWQLGAADADRMTGREKKVRSGGAVFRFESSGPSGERYPDGFFPGPRPRADAVEAAFGRHCRARGAPEAAREPDGSSRFLLRGVEPRSGASCALEVLGDPRDRWRFVIRLVGR
jgi:hypothetical protein